MSNRATTYLLIGDSLFCLFLLILFGLLTFHIGFTNDIDIWSKYMTTITYISTPFLSIANLLLMYLLNKRIEKSNIHAIKYNLEYKEFENFRNDFKTKLENLYEYEDEKSFNELKNLYKEFKYRMNFLDEDYVEMKEIKEFDNEIQDLEIKFSHSEKIKGNDLSSKLGQKPYYLLLKTAQRIINYE